ncbi:uncharacterized protein METZ01_LOCUS55820 [marine metagenome]|uniref:Uncharacterized protein n=1 Tax=marine metagenome TaxID=408172 RepID=A0A381SG54_9ZZZZ
MGDAERDSTRRYEDRRVVHRRKAHRRKEHQFIDDNKRSTIDQRKRYQRSDNRRDGGERRQ